jgi:hypothetical protein
MLQIGHRNRRSGRACRCLRMSPGLGAKGNFRKVRDLELGEAGGRY